MSTAHLSQASTQILPLATCVLLPPRIGVPVLGIDVAKDTLACTFFDPSSHQKLWFLEVENSRTGWKKLLKKTPDTSPWILEPTGYYSHGVARQAREAGRDVRLAQPKKAQSFLRSGPSRAKTDKLDSAGLAFYGSCCALAPYPLKSPMQEELDQPLLVRKGFSQSLSEWKARQKALPRAKSALEPAIAALKAQIRELDAQIAQLTRTPELEEVGESVKELQKVPGFGPVVASTLVSRLTARSFTRSDQFVAYCGLDIRIRQSGKKEGQIGLTKQGEAELRRLLYLAAQASISARDSPFKAQYEREQAKGLSKTEALCAIARKMARLAWSIVHHKSTYDPERIYQQN